MSSHDSDSGLSSSLESEEDYTIESLSYDELVVKLELAKLDYYIHHTNMHAVTRTIFENRHVPAAARATTRVRVMVEDQGIMYHSGRIALTDLQEEEDICRMRMREAQTKCRALEARRQELLMERKAEQHQDGMLLML